MRQGKLLEAEQVLVGLLSENTLNSMARVNLGYVYMKKGDDARASELLFASSRQHRDPKAALYGTFYRGQIEARASWKTGHSINRINIWGKRCADAIRLIDHGYSPPSFS